MCSPARRQSFIACSLTLAAVVVCSAIATANPPERVARVSFLSGAISFRPATIDDWTVAALNYPMTTGDDLWTDASGRAELQLGSSVVRLASNTSLRILNLDDQVAQFRLAQGALSVSVRDIDIALGEVVEVDTPNGAVSLREVGVYRIDAGLTGDQTTVTVRNGVANVATAAAVFDIDEHQSAVVTGSTAPSYTLQAAAPTDEWEEWGQRRDSRTENVMSQMYVSRDVIGYDDLDQAGTWESDPIYGPIWIPHVPAGWAPYRVGHWVWIEPWGWTWIDDAPWGFAPFHYGRWAMVSGGWAWAPDDIFARPVYVPALVAFVSSGGNSLGTADPIAWFPLGPHEVFVPAYQASPGYVQAVNAAHEPVLDIDIAHAVFVNRTVPGATTAMPRDAFVHSRDVAQTAIQVSIEVSRTASIVGTAAPVAPEASSVLGHRAGSAAPPAAVLSRQVVTRNSPPPPPVPFAARQAALEAHPGQPVDDETLRSLQAGTPATTVPRPPAPR